MSMYIITIAHPWFCDWYYIVASEDLTRLKISCNRHAHIHLTTSAYKWCLPSFSYFYNHQSINLWVWLENEFRWILKFFIMRLFGMRKTTLLKHKPHARLKCELHMKRSAPWLRIGASNLDLFKVLNINIIRKNLFEINNLKTLHGTFLLFFCFSLED